MKSALHCELLLPGMVRELAAAMSCPPALQALLRFARRSASFAGDDDAWRCAFFGVARQEDWPVAPFAALGDGLPAQSGYWLHADPVHLHLQRDHFVVEGIARAPSRLQGQQMVEALSAHFAAEGMQFFAPHAERWYLRLPRTPQLQTHSLSEAIGRNAERLLPQGGDAMQWHARLNEVQMLLHAHPANHDLEQQGAFPVNSVWLWGGGVLPEIAARQGTAVWAHDAFSRGLLAAQGRSVQPLPFSAQDWLESPSAEATHLIVLDQLQHAGLRDDPQDWHEALARIDRHWLQPLLAALRGGRLQGLTLHLADMHHVGSYTLQRRDLHKFWRRAQPLGNYLG